MSTKTLHRRLRVTHPNFRDRDGERNGRLVVRYPVGRDANGVLVWKCRCDCGTVVTVSTPNLRKTRSCGCLLEELRPTYGKRNLTDCPSYNGMHRRIRAWRGKASDQTCIECGEQASDWAYDHADPDEVISPSGQVYSTNVMHYVPMCRPHHHAFDRRAS
jgi:hypothetical protein